MASAASKALRTHPALTRSTTLHQQTRQAHDIVKQSSTQRPIIRSGPGGRSSFTGHVATVFGCTGFLGRYLVHQLAKSGTQVIVPYRQEDDKRHLKVMGDLGQIVPMEWSISNEQQIEECTRHSDVVYNLVGRDFETKRFTFNDVNVDAARRIARVCHQVGVSRFIHTSHINADLNSKSSFYQTKAEAEEIVKDIFPNVTIVKPSSMFGYEDKFLNKMVTKPWQFRVNDLETVVQPVSVHNVALAMTLMMNLDATMSKTVTLMGPNRYTFETLFQTIENITFRHRLSSGIHYPKIVLQLASSLWQYIWWPTLSPDQVTRKYIDDYIQLQPGTLTFQDLGISPDSIEQVAIAYLRHYRPPVLHDVPFQSVQPTTKS